MLFKEGSVGHEVRLIQSFLKKMGYKITSVDGEFGEETKQAVREYQKKVGISVDGWVGNHTISFMKKDGFVMIDDRGASVSTSLIKDFIKELNAFAEKYEGYIEIKPNADWDDPDIFGVQKMESDLLKGYMSQIKGWDSGAPYCSAFVGAAVCVALKRCGLLPDKFLGIWSAHVMTNVRYLQQKNILSLVPSMGSIWMAQFGITSSGHTGIVIDIQGDNIVTIEGNTSSGPTTDPQKQRSGDGVYKRKLAIQLSIL
jgi:hypothetical protein